MAKSSRRRKGIREEGVSIRVFPETHRLARLLAAEWDTTLAEAIARCVERVYQQEQVRTEAGADQGAADTEGEDTGDE